MQASLRVRNLLIASWETDRDRLRSALPQEVEPAPVDGRFLVSLAAFRVEGGRVGRVPLLPYSQLNVRAYVTWKGEPAVFFVAARVTAGGLPGVLLGAPLRYARLRVGEGTVDAPGRGVSLGYRPTLPGDPGPIGRHELGLFENDGLQEFRIERRETDWRGAELREPARADFLFALGFEPRGDPELHYAARSSFDLEVPRGRNSR